NALITMVYLSYSFSFFFQAEDGIRDFHVTGVQTCALPISFSSGTRRARARARVAPARPPPAMIRSVSTRSVVTESVRHQSFNIRSEERRVGEECRYRGGRSREERKEAREAGGACMRGVGGE